MLILYVRSLSGKRMIMMIGRMMKNKLLASAILSGGGMLDLKTRRECLLYLRNLGFSLPYVVIGLYSLHVT